MPFTGETELENPKFEFLAAIDTILTQMPILIEIKWNWIWAKPVPGADSDSGVDLLSAIDSTKKLEMIRIDTD